MENATVEAYPHCFGCGQENPIGLRLSPHVDGDAVVASFVPKDDHQGWPGIVHGGIIASLLYEVLENFAHQQRDRRYDEPNGHEATQTGQDGASR